MHVPDNLKDGTVQMVESFRWRGGQVHVRALQDVRGRGAVWIPETHENGVYGENSREGRC